MPDSAPGCGHEQLAQPDWLSHGDGPYVVRLTCQLCSATTEVDLGDVLTNEWTDPLASDEDQS